MRARTADLACTHRATPRTGAGRAEQRRKRVQGKRKGRRGATEARSRRRSHESEVPRHSDSGRDARSDS